MVRYIKIQLIIICFSVNLNTGFAQIIQRDECGFRELSDRKFEKQPWFMNNQFLDSFANKTQGDYKPKYMVPLKFWVYRNKDKTNGANEETLKKMVQELNNYNEINNTGFAYYLHPDITFINNSKKSTMGYYWEAPWQTFLHKKKGCLNIFIVNEFVRKSISRTTSISGTYNSVTRAVVIKWGTSNSGLSHEIGHYFALLHPHRNYNKGKRLQESVSRTRLKKGLFKTQVNCETNGDGLCDTPAEPNLSGYVKPNCEFMGDNLYDNWGELYQSETKNIMSYPTHRECRTKFTNQQIAVMNYSIQNDKYYKNWNLANPENIKFTVDAFEPDNSLLMSTDISYNMEQKHTLHKCIDGKKGKFLYQDIDYFKLDYNEIATREVIIQISKGDYGCESVQIQLFDASNSILHEKTGNLNEKNIEISLKNIKQGSYFIKISNSTHSKELEDYKIILKKL